MKGHLIPFVKVGRIILIDPKAADAAIDGLSRKTKVSQEVVTNGKEATR
jgi:hypothetical protein